jgi:hypothetical protein
MTDFFMLAVAVFAAVVIVRLVVSAWSERQEEDEERP